MKKFVTILLALVMSATVLTACSDPFKEPEENTEGKVAIQVGVLGTSTEQEALRKYKSGFQEKYSNVVIQQVQLPGGYSTAMDNFVATGNFPDVVFTPGDQHAAYSSRGHFLDLRTFDEADDTFSFDDIYPELIATTHYDSSDEGIWFMPRDYNKVVTFVNKDMLAAVPGENGQMYAGYGSFEELKKAWNTDTFYEVCAAVYKVIEENAENPDGVTDAQKQAGLTKGTNVVDARYNWAPVYEAMVRHYGGKMIDTSQLAGDATDWSKVLSVDTPETVTAYRELYKELSKPGYIRQSLASGGVSAFPNKKAAFWFTTRPSIGDINSANATFALDFLPFPYDYAGVGCSGYAITKKAAERTSEFAEVKAGTTEKMTNADYAWEFLKYVVSEEGQDAFGELGMGVPSLMSMKDKGEWLKYKSADLNHATFVEDVDWQETIAVNDIFCFPATAQKTISENSISIMTYVVKDNFWPDDLSVAVTDRTHYDAIYGKIDQYKDVMMTRIEGSLNV